MRDGDKPTRELSDRPKSIYAPVVQDLGDGLPETVSGYSEGHQKVLH